MKKVSFIAFILSVLFGFHPLQGQDASKASCGFDEYYQDQLRKDFELALRTEQAREQVRRIITRMKAERATLKTAQGLPDTTKYIIPVVVHVVHTGGSDSISLDQVVSGFEALFRDYRAVEEETGAPSVDTRIEFSLATIDEFGGNCPNGACVFWYNNPTLADIDKNSEDGTLKSTYSWDKSKYLNLYLVRSISGSSGGTILGYATFPTFSASTDGIVIRSDCWGTRGNVGGPGGDNRLGRTATHEMGHWLFLYHTFQGGCGNTSCAYSGDYICDTPPTANPNYTITARQNTCTQDAIYYGVDRADDPHNYMDYGSDFVIYKFSPEQTGIMQGVLENTAFSRRYPLWQWTNVVATGTGPYGWVKGFFYSSAKIVEAGGSVQFYEKSMGSPTSFEWSFPGGTPSTSTDRHPIVQYSTPGEYDVTLIVTNLSGRSDTITKKAYVKVVDNNSVFYKTAPYFEYFGGDSLQQIGWEGFAVDQAFYNFNMQNNVTVYNGIDYYPLNIVPTDKKGALQIANYYLMGFNMPRGFISPIIDISNLNNPEMFFHYAYTPHNKNGVDFNDTLEIQVTTDNGLTWNTIFKEGGDNLMTTPQRYGESSGNDVFFYPYNDTSLWKSKYFDLSNYTGQKVRIKFTLYCYEGNQFYLDNFQIGEKGAVNIDKELIKNQNITVFPNPANEVINLQITTPVQGEVAFTVYNLLGEKIISKNTYVSGKNIVPLDIKKLPKGTYFVKVHGQGINETIKFVK